MCTFGLVGVIPIFFVQLFRDDVEWASSLKTAIVILVATLPVAMPLVVTTALAVGSYELSQEKAIVQRLSAIEEVSPRARRLPFNRSSVSDVGLPLLYPPPIIVSRPALFFSSPASDGWNGHPVL